MLSLAHTAGRDLLIFVVRLQRGTVVPTVSHMLDCGDRSATMFVCVSQGV